MKKKKIDIEQLSRQNIHRVPDGYFDDLPMRIQSRIADENQKPVRTWQGSLIWQLSAAAVVLIIGAYFVFRMDSTNPNPEEMLASVSNEEIIQYLEQEDISTLDMSTLVDLDELITEQDLYLDPLSSTDLSDTDLESVYDDLDFSIDVL